MTVQKDPDVLSYNEAAAFLGVSRSCLERMVKRREVPSIRVTTRVRNFSKASLEKWKRDREAESLAPAPKSKSRKVRDGALSLVQP